MRENGRAAFIFRCDEILDRSARGIPPASWNEEIACSRTPRAAVPLEFSRAGGYVRRKRSPRVLTLIDLSQWVFRHASSQHWEWVREDAWIKIFRSKDWRRMVLIYSIRVKYCSLLYSCSLNNLYDKQVISEFWCKTSGIYSTRQNKEDSVNKYK